MGLSHAAFAFPIRGSLNYFVTFALRRFRSRNATPLIYSPLSKVIDFCMKQWYAIYVKSRTEKKVALMLSEAGLENFLPLRRTLKRWSDRKRWVENPLISGYCFVCVTEKEKLAVLQTTHVVNYVRFEGKPAVIPPNQIEFIRRMLNQHEVEYEASQQLPKPGQKVEIIAGPFIGLQAEMVKSKGKSVIFIRLEQIGNVFTVQIPLDHIMVSEL